MLYNHTIMVSLMPLPFLITGGNHSQRLSQVKLDPNPDLLVIGPDPTIGIQAVRSIGKFLQRKPYRLPLKTVVITEADKLTLEAQQALLKTLEEPPENSQIILLCPSETQLLPTIVSRCQVKYLSDFRPDQAWLEKQALVFEQFKQSAAAAGTNSETARELVTEQLRYLHYQLRLHPETANPKLIRALNRALLALKFNVNPKLTLEVLSLSY